MAKFTEFSFGYALTRELDGGKKSGLAPIFPSLYEEGKIGGYDVKIQNPIPVFLQFKLSRQLRTRNAREHKSGGEGLPYFRFAIRPGAYSDQHRLLHELEEDGNLVYYVAPCFESIDELNELYRIGAVHKFTAAIRPTDIGFKSARKAHHVVFRPHETSASVYSEKKTIPQYSLDLLAEHAKDNWRKRRKDLSEVEALQGLAKAMAVDIPRIENRKRQKSEKLYVPTAKQFLDQLELPSPNEFKSSQLVSFISTLESFEPFQYQNRFQEFANPELGPLVESINQSAMSNFGVFPLWLFDAAKKVSE